MDTAMLADAALARGVDHLKRSEYAEAIAAFMEAIEADPEAANAYVGRGLAHRALGDPLAALRDEQMARALGGPAPGAWDRLVKRAHRRWHENLHNRAWRRADPLCRDAFLLRQWVWNIHNGGLAQWVANGYGAWAEELAEAAERVGTEAARAVAAIVREADRLLAGWPGAREAMFRMIATGSIVTGREEQLFRELSWLEERYQRAGRRPGEFAADVDAWMERQMAKAA